MYCCVHRMTRYDEETGCYRGSQQFTHPQPDKHTTFCINTQHALIKYNPSSKHTIISDNNINRYILSPYSLLMRVDLSVSKLHIDHTITGMKIYAYLNVNIIFYSIKFRKLHNHIFLSCLYIYTQCTTIDNCLKDQCFNITDVSKIIEFSLFKLMITVN